MMTFKPYFNTITGRFLGFTKKQWKAEKKKRNMSDEQLLEILQVEASSRAKDKAAIRFFTNNHNQSSAL